MKYEEAAQLYAIQLIEEHGRKAKDGERVRLDVEVETIEGCPTCGPETSYGVTVYYHDVEEDRRRNIYKSFSGMTEILQALFEVSE